MATQDDQPPREGRRSRLEDEVLEILHRTDKPASFGDHLRRKAARRRRQRLGSWGRSLSGFGRGVGAGTLLIGCFALAFLAAMVRDTSALLANLLALASLLLLVWPIVDRYRRPDRGNVKTWRGRDLDLSPPPPAWIGSLRDRFRRPPKF